jgi:hypothetical protein
VVSWKPDPATSRCQQEGFSDFRPRMGFGSLEPAIAYAVEFARSSGLRIADYTGRVIKDELKVVAQDIR